MTTIAYALIALLALVLAIHAAVLLRRRGNG
jgi:hypothetical protein